MRLAILLALAACAARPRIAELPATPTPFCVRGTVMIGENAQAAMACFQTEAACQRAQRKVAGVGGLIGLKEISACRRQ